MHSGIDLKKPIVKGPVDSPFVVIGEAPGNNEMKTREPFTGASGQVLYAAIEQFSTGNLALAEPYMTNVIPHMAGALKKDSKQEYVHKLTVEHAPRLLEEVKAHPRKVILALGNAALWALTGDHSLKITKVRGQRFDSPLAEHGIVAAVHPAYLLRGNGSFRQFKYDVAYAISLANGGQPKQFELPTYEILDTADKVRWFVDKVKTHKGVIAGDTETSGFSHIDDRILCQGYTFDGKHVYVIMGKKTDYMKAFPGQDFTEHLGEMWDAPEDVKFAWQNGKFDQKFYWALGQRKCRVDEDTMFLSYALDETRGVHDLETLASDWLGSPNWKGILDQYKKKNQSYDVIPWEVLVKYMVYDIANTFNLVPVLRQHVNADAKSRKLYEETLIPASEYLAGIEDVGMYVDRERVEENHVIYTKEIEEHKDELNKLSIASGFGPINPNSPAQLANLMYNTMKLPRVDGMSTDAKTLEALPQTPFVVRLGEYRKVAKGHSTYVKPYRPSVKTGEERYIASDGCVHTSYLLHGTATGRLASRDPNLQNIPREPGLRGQFIPKPGYCYIEVDLNQAELRSLAVLSGDEALCAIYADPNSKGLHEELRIELYGMPADWSPADIEKYQRKWYIDEKKLEKGNTVIDRIKEEQKMRCKNVNFGIVYGITPFGLAEQIDDSAQEAARMLAGWAKKFPRAWKLIQVCRNAPLFGKTIVTPFGHKKRFQLVAPERLIDMQNEAANFPHQSTASTITLHAGMRVQKKLKAEFDTDIVNTVHDSIILQAPMDKDAIEGASMMTKLEMEKVPVDYGLTRIPFQADRKIGLRWGSMGKMSEFYDQHFAN